MAPGPADGLSPVARAVTGVIPAAASPETRPVMLVLKGSGRVCPPDPELASDAMMLVVPAGSSSATLLEITSARATPAEIETQAKTVKACEIRRGGIDVSLRWRAGGVLRLINRWHRSTFRCCMT